MLGFIESILGPAVGLLTSEDGEEYSDMMNELHTRQSNLSRIMGKQTHIVKVEIEEIHKELCTRTEEIQQTQPLLERSMKNLQNQGKSINDLLYLDYTNQWTVQKEKYCQL